MCRLEDTSPPKSLGNLSESLKALAEKCVLDPSRESPLPEVGSLFAIPVCRASHRDICGLATDACTSHVTVRATRRTRGEEASGIRACLDRRHLLPLVLPPSPEPPSLLSSVHLLHSCPTSSDTASPFLVLFRSSRLFFNLEFELRCGWRRPSRSTTPCMVGGRARRYT